MSVELSGIFPALATPFVDGRVALDRLAENIGRYERHRLAGYLVLGSTGETAYLDEAEKIALLRAAHRAVPAGKTLIAGVGLESTAATVRLAAVAADCGADAALVLTPYFFRSRMSADALLRHYTAVADASPVPTLLYNVPKFTGVAIPPATVAALAPHPNVAGLKDSSGDVAWLLAVLSQVPPAFSVLCGGPAVLQPALAAGAAGAVLALANVLPEAFNAIYRRQREGDTGGAIALQRRLMTVIRGTLGGTEVPGVKAAMDARGLFGGPPRPPLLPVTAAERAAIRVEVEELVAAGVLPALGL